MRQGPPDQSAVQTIAAIGSPVNTPLTLEDHHYWKDEKGIESVPIIFNVISIYKLAKP